MKQTLGFGILDSKLFFFVKTKKDVTKNGLIRYTSEGRK
ncbi:Uncharacterised protein [Streptococcus acidominimus]|uniref:Uncharacterized protein n=1 Tax=Streptococcus acidominimus TaxID=1326 RepID=A0A239XA81_STRAI|nr:Uncharacterised protein [Streptococcus acidominimus]